MLHCWIVARQAVARQVRKRRVDEFDSLANKAFYKEHLAASDHVRRIVRAEPHYKDVIIWSAMDRCTPMRHVNRDQLQG